MKHPHTGRLNRCWIAVGTEVDKAVPGHADHAYDSKRHCMKPVEVVMQRDDYDKISYVCHAHALAWDRIDNTWRSSSYIIKELGLDLER